VHPVLLDSSFLIDLEHEIESGEPGKAIAWLRAERGRNQRALMVSCVSVAEVLEGSRDEEQTLVYLSHFIPQHIGHQHAIKCSELQRKASKRGKRFGENDAWQLAFAECAKASIVGRDTSAFTHLGDRYEQY